MNEYYELIEDSDLDGTAHVRSWIWFCPECNALFGSKAIPNRTIFPWFGYHPGDGHCRVLTEETARKVQSYAHRCECDTPIKHVPNVQTLTKCIEHIKNNERG